MSQLDQVREAFIQLMERITEQRGFTPIHGRILACLLLSHSPQTQRGIAKWTGYSVSAVSRTLEQMVAFGSVRRFKQPGTRSYQYEMDASLPSLFIGPFERWLSIVDSVRGAFSQLAEAAQDIDRALLTSSQRKEVSLLTSQLQQLVDTLQTVTPVLKEMLNRFQTLSH